jgi:hypothetical protein
LKANPEFIGFIKIPLETLKKRMKIRMQLLTWAGIFMPEHRDELNEWAVARGVKNYKWTIAPTETLSLTVVQQNGKMLADVPFPTSAVYRAAILQNESAAKLCQPSTEDDAIWLMQQNPHLLKHVRNQTVRVVMTAIEYDPNALQWVRDQTDAICRKAVRRNPAALKWARCQPNEMCMEAIKRDPNALRWVLEQTPAMCVAAVELDPNSIIHVKPSIYDEIILMDIYDL